MSAAPNKKKRDPKLKGGPWNTVLFFLNKSLRPRDQAG